MEMTNEEKAKQIAQYHCANELNLIQAYNAALDMAEWKDEQHEQEKQKMIEKAYEFISKKFFISVSDQAVSKENYCLLTELISDLTKAMKGE